jgi:hypothetical protein
MRKLIVLSFISLDGVMQAPGGPEEDPTGGFKHEGWVAGYFDDFLGKVMDRLVNPLICCLAEKHTKYLRRTGRT